MDGLRVTLCLAERLLFVKINLKPGVQPISHPQRLRSSAFETTVVPVINCFKKFTFSLPLEPSKHKLAAV